MGQSDPEALKTFAALQIKPILLLLMSLVLKYLKVKLRHLYRERKRKPFNGKKYTVTISKDGHTERTVTVDTKVNGWYVANVLLGHHRFADH